MPYFSIGDLVRHEGSRDQSYPCGMVGRVECFYNDNGVFRTSDPVFLEGIQEVGVFFQDMCDQSRGHDLDCTANFEYGGWWCMADTLTLLAPHKPRVWPPNEPRKARYNEMETEYV